jgi:hypothetical protein
MSKYAKSILILTRRCQAFFPARAFFTPADPGNAAPEHFPGIDHPSGGVFSTASTGNFRLDVKTLAL